MKIRNLTELALLVSLTSSCVRIRKDNQEFEYFLRSPFKDNTGGL